MNDTITLRGSRTNSSTKRIKVDWDRYIVDASTYHEFPNREVHGLCGCNSVAMKKTMSCQNPAIHYLEHTHF